MSEEKKKKNAVESPTEDKAVATRPSTTMSRGIDQLFDDFRRSFDDFMAPFLPMRTFWPARSTGFPMRAPLVDLLDKGDHFVIRSELPGFSKDMVDIELNKDTLVLRAEKKSENREDSDYLHRERSYSVCERTINFPEEVNPSKVDGNMDNGILELKVFKKEPSPEEKMRKVKLK